MPQIWSVRKSKSSAPSAGAQPASGSLLPPSSLPSPPALPRIYPHPSPSLHTAVQLTPAEPARPSTSRPPHSAGPTDTDMDILPDNTYTPVNNGSQTCSWQDHIAMSDVLSESMVDCHTLQDVACSDHCAITVTFNFYQVPMTHSIEGQKTYKLEI